MAWLVTLCFVSRGRWLSLQLDSDIHRSIYATPRTKARSNVRLKLINLRAPTHVTENICFDTQSSVTLLFSLTSYTYRSVLLFTSQ